MRPRVYIAGPISKGDLTHNVNQATAAFVALAKAGFAPFCPHWSVYSKPAQQVWRFEGETPEGYPETVPCADQCECLRTASGNDEMSHDDWLGVDLPWVEASHALLRLDGESVGADRELKHANSLRIPVFYSIADLIDWKTAGNFGAA